MSNLFGIDISFQSDPRWSGLVLEFPTWQNKPDTIGQFGCLLCASLNTYNHHNYITKSSLPQMTVAELNQKMIDNYGYNYLYWMHEYAADPDCTEKVKNACYGREAFLLPNVLDKILGIKQRINFTGVVDLAPVNEYYLLHTNFMNTEAGHWSWLVNNDGQTIVDSWDGVKRTYSKDKVLGIIKLVF